MKLGFLYAGQGSQHPGMGADLYEAYPAFRKVLDAAQAEVDFDLKRTCFEDPEGVLNQTRYTQPCMVAFAAGLTAVLREKGIVPSAAAGLSLGEYSALHAAGVFDAETAVRLVAFRGKAMEEAAKGRDSAMVAVLGSSLNNAILAISLSWWPWYTRLIRGQAISMKERKFVQAAETIGTGRMKIIFRHIIPNCISPVIVQASMDIGGVILTVASLSFLSLGAQLPTPEWGLMISMGRRFFPDSWWYCIFPGLAIFITVLCFNLLGDAIREILDPKTRKN